MSPRPQIRHRGHLYVRHDIAEGVAHATRTDGLRIGFLMGVAIGLLAAWWFL